MDNEMNTVQIPAEKLVDALLHAKQFEHHYATQESVDNLKEFVRELKADNNKRFEQIDKRFEQIDKRFEQVDKRFDKRFDKLEGKFDRLQWLIVVLTFTVFFKEHILKFFA
ncbi:hypothetical protein [Vibrio maritimus]|uniref:hypothetical protein n=1 Tax=Vibrio maritimus TaxID=990268 RepID=UPI001F3E3DB3|nr:hypothetical protein [Vibrio maritimus]